MDVMSILNAPVDKSRPTADTFSNHKEAGADDESWQTRHQIADVDIAHAITPDELSSTRRRKTPNTIPSLYTKVSIGEPMTSRKDTYVDFDKVFVDAGATVTIILQFLVERAGFRAVLDDSMAIRGFGGERKTTIGYCKLVVSVASVERCLTAWIYQGGVQACTLLRWRAWLTGVDALGVIPYQQQLRPRQSQRWID